MSDVFDSDDDSEGGFVTFDKKVKPENEESVKMDVDESGDKLKCEDKKTVTAADKIAVEAVAALGLYYENMSFLDSYVSQSECYKEGPCSKNKDFDWSNGALTPGLCDQKITWDESDWWRHNYAYDIIGQVEVKSLQLTNDKLTDIKSKKSTLDMVQMKSYEEQMVLPVAVEEMYQEKINTRQESAEQKRLVYFVIYTALKMYMYSQTYFA